MKDKKALYNQRMSKRYKKKEKAAKAVRGKPDYTGVTGLSRTNGVVLKDVHVPSKRGTACVSKIHL